MNIFYCCCIHEPWLEVACQLKDKGYNPSYWIGWREGEQFVKDRLPNTIYHDIDSAWRGIFPQQVGSYPYPATIDGLELKNVSYNELIALRMIERLDRDRESFTFKERQYFFRRLLNDWIYILQKEQIELIIFPSTPHRFFDYVIYTAAQILEINFLCFKKTRWQGELIPLHSTIDTIPNLTTKKHTKSIKKVEDYINQLLTKTYNEAEPDYMVAQKKDAQKSFSKKLIDKAKTNPSKLTKLFEEFPSGWKKRGERIEKSRYTRAEVYIDEYKGNLYKKKLKEYYESLCEEVKPNEEYILVALHYQPETNSVPEGNIYGDQLLVVRALLKHTPENITIAVKEHSSQFMPKLEGQTGRTREFYDQLKAFKRVKLISTSKDPFAMIDNAIGVSSLIGNICLEAIIRGKSAVLFGNAWYEHCYGVLKVDNAEKMKQIYSHFKSFTPNLPLLKQQINSIVEQCTRANHYKRVAQQSDISNEESINNLVNLITTSYPNE